VHPGYIVTVTVSNYDDMPHSFTSPSLAVNETIPAGSANAPTKTTFTFTAPSKAGSYPWWCALPRDPWAMAHDGYMRGHVIVSA
jgi:plastocyanin